MTAGIELEMLEMVFVPYHISLPQQLAPCHGLTLAGVALVIQCCPLWLCVALGVAIQENQHDHPISMH